MNEEGVRRVRDGRTNIGFEVSTFFWELLLRGNYISLYS
jgi:hypothetical protein